MRLLTMVLIALACASALAAAPAKRPAPAAAAAPATDPAARLLADVAANYRAMSSYDVSGASHVEINGGAFHNVVDVPMRFAARLPRHIYTYVQNPNFASLLVANQDSVWTYMPGVRQFTVRAANDVFAEGAAPLPEDFARLLKPLEGYGTMDANVRAVRGLGRDTVQTEAGPIECERLEVDYVPDPDHPELTDWPKVFWIDPSQRIVVRDSARSDVMHPQMGQVTTMQLTRYVSAKYGEGAPDSLFTFTPPLGARRFVQQSPAEPAEGPRSELEGKPAPPFSLAALTGKPVKLASLKGKVVMLDFWATWCGPCRRWMPIVQKVSGELKAKGLVTYAVNLRESEAKIRPYLKQNNVTVPVLLDSDGSVATAYGAVGIPLTVIVGKDGKVARTLMGLHSEAQLRAALKEAGF